MTSSKIGEHIHLQVFRDSFLCAQKLESKHNGLSNLLKVISMRWNSAAVFLCGTSSKTANSPPKAQFTKWLDWPDSRCINEFAIKIKNNLWLLSASTTIHLDFPVSFRGSPRHCPIKFNAVCQNRSCVDAFVVRTFAGWTSAPKKGFHNKSRRKSTKPRTQWTHDRDLLFSDPSLQIGSRYSTKPKADHT